MDDEKLKYIVQEKLRNHTSPVEPADWDIIYRGLQQRKQRKAVAAWFFVGAAAATVALFLMLRHPSVTEPLQPVDAAVAITAVDTAAAGETLQPATVAASLVSVMPPAATAQPEEKPAVQMRYDNVPEKPNEAKDTIQFAQANIQRPTTLPDSAFAVFLQTADIVPEKKTTKKWELALLAGQSGGVSFSNGEYAYASDASPAPGGVSGGEKPIELPSIVDKTNHHTPLSFGLTFRYYFASHWALESGLVYTYLSSDYTYMNRSGATQRMHYLGLPVNVVHRFFHSKRFSFYLSGGGMLEKGLSEDYTFTAPEKQPVHNNIAGVQWSLNGQFGAEYKLFERFSLYAEPGVRYFIPETNQPQSIRTEQLFSFTIGFGLRANF